MKKGKKSIVVLSQLIAVVFCLLHTSWAMPEDVTQTVVQQEDPIVSTLDSLINQNFIFRLNNSSVQNQNTENFQSREIPTYADEVYRKRIEKIQTPIPLAFNEEVKKYIDLYAVNKRGLTERVMGLANYYFPLYEQILDQQQLPLEFKYLSIVESALNPTAVSRMGATGLWQFMLGTGRLYHLKINSLVDERRDPLKSTQAACQYFKDMYSIYNDWLLVIAAYNCGAGNVNRAIARSGGKKTFWEINQYLPRETRGYVPAFIAVTYLMNYSAEHNLNAIPPQISYFEADTVKVDQKITFREIADVTGVPVELISYLNPIYKRGIIPEADEPQVLRLPSGKINAFLTGLDHIFHLEEETAAVMTFTADASSDNSSLRKVHRVKRGEHLQGIAQRYHCSVSEIKQWNRLKNGKLTAGQKLTVYVNTPKKKDVKLVSISTKGQEVPFRTVNQRSIKTSQTNTTTSLSSRERGKPASKSAESKILKTIYHVVQPGDTLWKIAQRYEGATVELIKEMNQLRSNDLKVGTKLKVPVGV